MFGIFFIFFSTTTLLNAQRCQNPNDPTTLVNCELVPECNFQENGTLTPLATQCNNELPDVDCQQLFPCDPADTPPCRDPADVGGPTPEEHPFVRAPACTNPSLHDIAMKCARTCALCCQTSEYNSTDCNSTKSLCKDGDCGKVVVSVVVKTN